jgi:hypothetical protein
MVTAPEQSSQPNQVCFLLKEHPFALMPFWNRVMVDGGQLRHGPGVISSSTILLECVQKE